MPGHTMDEPFSGSARAIFMLHARVAALRDQFGQPSHLDMKLKRHYWRSVNCPLTPCIMCSCHFMSRWRVPPDTVW